MSAMDDLPFYPPQIQRGLRKLAGLTDQQFEALRNEVRKAQTFSRSPDRVKVISALLGDVGNADAYNLVSSLQALYYRCRQWERERPKQPYDQSLMQFLEFSGLADVAKLRERLVPLLAPNPELDRDIKRRTLSRGFGNSVSSFSSFVDLRPNLDPQRTDVQELIPVVTVKIEYETPDSADQAFVCQLGPAALRDLRNLVASLDEKLALIRSKALGGVPVFWVEQEGE